MKNIVGTATNTGNIDLSQGEKTRIHPAAYGVLMDMLSGMYGNAMKAALREYAVNGWDEHQKQGLQRPVEVTLPTLLQPTLEIRDYGAGIPLEGVYGVDPDGKPVCLVMGAMEVFGEYGHSSKRDTNVEAGGFGIGSKAAFAMGHQFIVVGYKDGQTFTVLFSLNDDGTGTKSVLHEGETTEPNGLKVIIGVNDIDAMHEAARDFFQFWNRGDVLVDGVEPTPIFETLERINDEIYVSPNGRGEAFAVMGPVAYPVDRALLGKVSKYLEKQGMAEVSNLPLKLVDSSTDVYLRVPIGGVIPAPNREMLRDKERTVHSLGAIFYGLHQDSAVKVQANVDAAPSFYAAAKAFEDTNGILGAFAVSRKTVLWKGQRIVTNAAVNLTNYTLVKKSWRHETRILGIESKATLTIEQAEKTLTVVGVPEDQWGAVKRYSKRFLEENTLGVDRVFVTEAEAVSFGWFQVGVPQGARTMTLDEWRATLKTMRKASPRTVNEPSYTWGFKTASRDLDERDLLSDIIGAGDDIVIFVDSAVRLNKFQRQVLEGYSVVVLLGTQSEDMLRKHIAKDGSVKVVEWSTLAPLAKAAAQAVVDGVTDAEKEALGARAWLSENSSYRASVQAVLEALSLAGEVTHKALLSVEDSFTLAEVFAEPITEARVKEIQEARRAVTGSSYVDDLSDLAVSYDDTVESAFSNLPLLNFSEVKHAAHKINRHVQIGEDGEVTFVSHGFYNTYDQDDYDRDLMLLQHTLDYVNNH